ncbi:MAG: YhbY family RNA-binding protein [Candidatus Woesearchaeota archaeon]
MPSKVNHHVLEPALRIGKAGITDNAIRQVKALLKKRKVIKVKFLTSAIKENKKELVKELAEKAHAKVIHKVGFIAVLERLK